MHRGVPRGDRAREHERDLEGARLVAFGELTGREEKQRVAEAMVNREVVVDRVAREARRRAAFDHARGQLLGPGLAFDRIELRRLLHARFP